MIRKIVSVAAILILALVLSCAKEQSVPPETLMLPTPVPQEITLPILAVPQAAVSEEAQEESEAPFLQIASWEIENKFPKGMRIVVGLHHTFLLDFEASRLEMRLGKDQFWQIAPEVDLENPNPDQIVFVLKGGSSFHTWTEVENGKVTVKDKEGHEVTLETGPFVYKDPRFTWQENGSENVRVLFYGPQDKVQPENVPREAEELLKRFSFIPKKKIRVIVYESRQDIDVALPFRSHSTTKQLITLGMAFKEINAVLVLRIDSKEEVADTIRHELMHLVFDYLTQKTLVPLPTWLNEGLAMHAGSENLAKHEKYTIFLALENGRLLPLRQLSSFSGKPKLTMLSYAESHSFVRFVIQRYGQDTMLGFLRVLNESFGMTFEEAVEKVYGKPLDSLEREWVEGLTTKER